ncbi:MAG: ATP-binding cassette domain-containing protein [Bryobacteraceae bacterium]
MTSIRVRKRVSAEFALEVDFVLGGGVTALIGQAGAGKTVLLEMIAGLATPDDGRILLEDAIVFDGQAGVNLPPVRRGCGYISQTDSLFPHRTLRQNLEFAARRFPRLERHRRVAEAIEHFTLADAAEMRPAAAGSAERLRCATARALIGEPGLLLADDAGMDGALFGLIRGRFRGSILLATRDLDLACTVASEVALLDRGRIVQRGRPRQVLDEPATAEAARLAGYENLWQGTIAELDRAANISRLECGGFSLTVPYLPGHLRGDRVWVAIRAAAVRPRRADTPPAPNLIPAKLVRVAERAQSVRLEFEGPIVAELALSQFAALGDNKSWLIEFPGESLRVIA